jgi:hypothetical protein
MELQKINQNQSAITTPKMNSLQEYLQEIPDSAPEKALLQVKYSAVPFIKMDAGQIYDSAAIALLKISIITGWAVLSGDMQKILVDQLAKHLKESYMTVNMNEIEYAFRQFGTTTKDWGKSLNLSLFDEVMSVYMEKRRQASEEERRRPLEVKQIEAPKMTNIEIIEMAKGLWEKMQKVDLIYPDAYRALVEEKLINHPLPREQQVYYIQLSEKRMKEYENEDRKFFNGKDRDEWRKIYARKLVVSDYFKGYLNEEDDND